MPWSERWLDRLHTAVAVPGVYWRVHSTKHPEDASLHQQAIAPNIYSRGRFAWRCGGRGTLYFAADPLTALWETALAKASINGNLVHALPKDWKTQSLAQLRLKHPLPIIDLRQPQRRRIVDADSELDDMWAGLLVTRHYQATHEAPPAVRMELEPMTALMGMAYPSRRNQGGNAYVAWHAMSGEAGTWWETAAPPVPLGTAAGQARLAHLLAEQGLVWVGDASAGAPDAPPGAL